MLTDGCKTLEAAVATALNYEGNVRNKAESGVASWPQKKGSRKFGQAGPKDFSQKDPIQMQHTLKRKTTSPMARRAYNKSPLSPEQKKKAKKDGLCFFVLASILSKIVPDAQARSSMFYNSVKTRTMMRRFGRLPGK